MKIEILGAGCPKCAKLAESAKLAATELGVEFELIKVTEIDDILKFDVLITPALAIDGEVKSVGKSLSVEEIKTFMV